MATTSYAIAVGSNRCGRHGAPAVEVRAALALLGGHAAPVMTSAPVGPSLRRYANTVAILDSDLTPPEMLAWLKRIERSFGRRRGRRWGARVIDLDIILWSGGAWSGRDLTIPHPHFRERDFVLTPLAAIAPDWRDPVSGLTVRQLRARLTVRRPAPSRAIRGWGP
ncbi:7,8-dihydro-6-hydroxymethylpterin-pyrophosphokinase [Sphingomonas sp. Leaf33]|uniref:2-amino-4-hydroxy-6- hydroxymethyldihydropteridine diphosphokinase n=1 Tax=Sphingomonas sp. Leaf33 TaxID=1736215 RepID=UPI0006F24A59|nr:2-amino-4-hydroxy-6-hydroxymethyldihydropteridine diphosphokinase [Sphingomonas sp. Leaf33]KQN26845.1 7,8-dihydro-6-hydroxymethylpterin-pyrophosphokinase [Sphingomonas sp. Leaf33]